MAIRIRSLNGRGLVLRRRQRLPHLLRDRVDQPDVDVLLLSDPWNEEREDGVHEKSRKNRMWVIAPNQSRFLSHGILLLPTY